MKASPLFLGLPACRNRKVLMSRRINPLVNLEFCQISNRGNRLPPGAEKFTALLRSYIATRRETPGTPRGAARGSRGTCGILESRAGLAELADAPDSKSGDRKVV
jgi:hypothetical protein